MSDAPNPLGAAPRGSVVPREAVLAEVARIVEAPEFARAPVMRRLLEFLVRETLEGRGDQLKAYAIAVDGLGRPPDFDAQADSYPRVQVGRLRRMLDSFYAQAGTGGEGVRLSIPAGRYRVHPIYPEAAPPPAPAATEPAAPAARGAARRFRWGLVAVALCGAALLLGLALWGLERLHALEKPRLVAAPVLELAHLKGARVADALDLDVNAVLLDGIRRSWLVRVRTSDRPAAATAIEPPAYQLAGDVTGGSAPVARLRLLRGRSGETLWTGQVALSQSMDALRAALAPLIAELVQPYGVIATDQRAQIGDSAAPGYPCMLQFDQYRRDRNSKLYAETRRCMARTLALDPADPLALAAQAILLVDEAPLGFGPAQRGAVPHGIALARRAVAADPYSAVAQMALARTLSIGGNCGAAVRAGRRAIALDPNNPDLYAALGNLLVRCGDPGAEAMIRRALALDPSPPPSVYGPLVLLALERGDWAAARAAAAEMPPWPNATRPLPDIILAAVATAEGNRVKARRIWAGIEASNPAVARDPDKAFREWGLADRYRLKLLDYLRSAGLIAAASR